MVGSGANVMGIRMGRGRRGLLDDLAVLPWSVELAVGVLGFGLIRYVPAARLPVNVVREICGLLAHHGSHAVQIATTGRLHARCRALRAGDANRADRDRDALLGMLQCRQTECGDSLQNPPSNRLQLWRRRQSFL